MIRRTIMAATRDVMTVDDERYTVSEVADRLKVDPSVVRRWIYAGVLKGYQVGGRRWRVTRRHLEAFLASEAKES
jgi:excisionase family DNA binding protein